MKEFKGTLEIDKNMYEALRACMSNDETRYFLNGVWIDKDNNKIVSTDGRRLICYDLPEDVEISTGFYDPIKNGKKFQLIPADIEGTYPNYERVLPEYYTDTAEYQIIKNETSSAKFTAERFCTGNLVKDSIMICELITKSGCYFNLEYLKVLKYLGGFTYYGKETNSAILFEFTGVRLVIMPMQQD